MNDLIRLQNDAQNDFIKRQNEWAEKELAEI
jgi:hypothetical protein